MFRSHFLVYSYPLPHILPFPGLPQCKTFMARFQVLILQLIPPNLLELKVTVVITFNVISGGSITEWQCRNWNVVYVSHEGGFFILDSHPLSFLTGKKIPFPTTFVSASKYFRNLIFPAETNLPAENTRETLWPAFTMTGQMWHSYPLCLCQLTGFWVCNTCYRAVLLNRCLRRRLNDLRYT